MKKFHVVAVVCVLLLSGCACLKGLPTLEERSHPQVMVRDGRIIISPAVLYFLPGERDIQIVWQLSKDSKYRFPTAPKTAKDAGIFVEGRLADRMLRSAEGADSVALERQAEIIDCKVRNEFEFVCLNKHTEPGLYKYSITLREGSNELKRDPPIVNM